MTSALEAPVISPSMKQHQHSKQARTASYATAKVHHCQFAYVMQG